RLTASTPAGRFSPLCETPMRHPRGARRRSPSSLPGSRLEDLHGERVLDHALDHALQRARARGRVVAPLGEELARLVGELERDAPLRDQLPHAVELDLDDPADLLAAELVVDDDLVDAVQELRLEVRAQRLLHAALHLLALRLAELGDPLAADV